MKDWIRNRFNAIVTSPLDWGSQEVIENSLLLLIEEELVVLDRDVDLLYEEYQKLKRERFPMIGSAVSVAAAVGRVKDESGYLASTPEGTKAVADFCVELRARLGLA